MKMNLLTDNADNTKLEKVINYNFIGDTTALDTQWTPESPKVYNFEAKYDELRLFNPNVSGATLQYLLKAYGEEGARRILTIGTAELDKSIPLLKSQLYVEIKEMDLKYPTDFLLKRHNYINILRAERTLVSFLLTYCETKEASSQQISHELIKLLGLKDYLKIGL
jgi:hypothetical protein